MRIAIDFDSAMCNTMQQWCKELNKVVPEYLIQNVDNLPFYDMKLNYPTLLDKQIWAPLLQSDFWLSVQPIEGAVEVIKNLKKAGHEIFIVTSDRFDCMQTKYAFCISRWFPFISYKNIIICKRKDILDVDVLIDSFIDNLKGNQPLRLLMNYSYNKDCRLFTKLHKESSCQRVYDWTDILHYIHKYERSLKSGTVD